ncbi:MAG: zinc-ribbon domain containing protein [Acidobacteria bacterium]|nr:zinc-ribbon domain containing protein [Acidobacteriota bacterium]
MSDNGFSDSFSAPLQASAEEPQFTDQTINCMDCHSDFVWTVGEQQFFYDKNLQNPPKRCKPCKQAKNERIAAINAAHELGVKQRIEVLVACAKCGCNTTVPFYPSQGRPVYCRSCYLELNPSLLPPHQ